MKTLVIIAVLATFAPAASLKVIRTASGIIATAAEWIHHEVGVMLPTAEKLQEKTRLASWHAVDAAWGWVKDSFGGGLRKAWAFRGEILAECRG